VSNFSLKFRGMFKHPKHPPSYGLGVSDDVCLRVCVTVCLDGSHGTTRDRLVVDETSARRATARQQQQQQQQCRRRPGANTRAYQQRRRRQYQRRGTVCSRARHAAAAVLLYRPVPPLSASLPLPGIRWPATGHLPPPQPTSAPAPEITITDMMS